MRLLLSVIVLLTVWGTQSWVSSWAQPTVFNTSQGSGWILLSLGDLNGMLEQMGYPTLANSVPIYGGSTVFPRADAQWRWGLAGLFWNSRGGETVSLDASFFGGVFDWALHRLPSSRFSAGLSGGFGFSQLTIRKDLAFDFDDVLDPNEGQFSLAQRWGLWAAPYAQYQLEVLNSGFEAKVWGGFLTTPWLSGWSQGGNLLAPVEFPGPPSALGGLFVMTEISFGF